MKTFSDTHPYFPETISVGSGRSCWLLAVMGRRTNSGSVLAGRRAD